MNDSGNGINDPLGIEVYTIDEAFESLFKGLVDVYARLYFKEFNRPEDLRSKEKEEFYYSKFKEMGVLKDSFETNDWEGKRQAVKDYSPELQEMVNIELTEYATIR